MRMPRPGDLDEELFRDCNLGDANCLGYQQHLKNNGKIIARSLPFSLLKTTEACVTHETR